MAWDSKPKFSKLTNFTSLLEKLVEIQTKEIEDRIDKIQKVIEGKKKLNELAAKDNSTSTR